MLQHCDALKIVVANRLVLDCEFHAVDSGFQSLVEFRFPVFGSPAQRIPDSTRQSGIRTPLIGGKLAVETPQGAQNHNNLLEAKW